MREYQRKLEDERREREGLAHGGLAEPPEAPQGSEATSSQDGGDDEEGGVLEGSGASREEIDSEEMERWRAAEEAAAARKAKEKGESSYSKTVDLPSETIENIVTGQCGHWETGICPPWRGAWYQLLDKALTRDKVRSAASMDVASGGRRSGFLIRNNII